MNNDPCNPSKMSTCSLVSLFSFFQQQTMHLPFDMASFSFLLSTVNSARLFFFLQLEKQKTKTKTIFIIITCLKKITLWRIFFKKKKDAQKEKNK